ncbi:MAG: hypothetical protein A3J28_15815 [Acidobacteria bacterium RIFCSPLOWO2_12_FULL_60_22]|nr:MAG: hypothetical protein A3J28_15815 [Acidobacteria bacterium RIFCSPLOWO2_12_FULL_60_22]
MEENGKTLEGFDLRSLTERLQRLEKQNRKFKQGCILVLVLSTCFLLMGQSPRSRTVEANEFILKDSNGKMRGVLRVRSNVPEFTLLDDKGGPRISLKANLEEDSSTMYFLGANGNVQAVLSGDKSGGLLSLGILGSHGAVLVAGSNSAGLGLLSNLSLDQQGRTWPGNLGAELSVKSGVPSLALMDTRGKTIWSAP